MYNKIFVNTGGFFQIITFWQNVVVNITGVVRNKI